MGKCLARDRVPQVQSQKRQAERGKQTAGSKSRGNTPGGKDAGGMKRGRRWVGACPRVPGEGVFDLGSGGMGAFLLLLQTRPDQTRAEPTVPVAPDNKLCAAH